MAFAIMCSGGDAPGMNPAIKKFVDYTYKLGLETRVTIIGHVQKGGNPTVYDRMMAFDFTINAVDYLNTHKDSNKVVVYNKGVYSFMDIKEVVSNKYKLPEHYINTINYLD